MTKQEYFQENDLRDIRNKKYNFLWKTGFRKYKLTLTGEMRLNTMQVKSIIENHFILNVKKIYDANSFEGDCLINLISYDKQMVECNNQGFKEMFVVTRLFERLYDEFETVITQKGQIKTIENLPFLQEKWKRIKNDAVQYFNDSTDIESFFKLNDSNIKDEGFWKKMLNEQEFFFLFFELPNYKTSYGIAKHLNRGNAFRTGNIKWNIEYEKKEYPEYTDLYAKGIFNPAQPWLAEGYGKMPFMESVKYQPLFRIEAQYLLDTDGGFIKEAWIYLEETVHPSILAHKLRFHIEQIN